MNKMLSIFLAFTSIFLCAMPSRSSAQVSLACPTGSQYGVLTLPPGPLYEGSTIYIWVRESIFSGPAAGFWDFDPMNIVVAGFQISATAVGRIGNGGFMGQPTLVPFGPLNAGSYTFTLNAVATNVTPNVACPPLTLPIIVVPTGSSSVPVPAQSSWLSGLAALLLAITGAIFIRVRETAE